MWLCVYYVAGWCVLIDTHLLVIPIHRVKCTVRKSKQVTYLFVLQTA
jgi:hypothetical protein